MDLICQLGAVVAQSHVPSAEPPIYTGDLASAVVTWFGMSSVITIAYSDLRLLSCCRLRNTHKATKASFPQDAVLIIDGAIP